MGSIQNMSELIREGSVKRKGMYVRRPPIEQILNHRVSQQEKL